MACNAWAGPGAPIHMPLQSSKPLFGATQMQRLHYILSTQTSDAATKIILLYSSHVNCRLFNSLNSLSRASGLSDRSSHTGLPVKSVVSLQSTNVHWSPKFHDLFMTHTDCTS